MSEYWGTVPAIVSTIVALVALGLQRRDLKKQSKYQRDTFELQNRIEETNLLIEISSEIISNVDRQAEYLSRLYTNIHIVSQLETFKDTYKCDKEQVKRGIEDTKNVSKTLWDAQRNLSEKFTQLSNTLIVHLTNYEQKSDVCEMINTMASKLNDMKKEIDEIDFYGESKTDKELNDWGKARVKDLDTVLKPFQKVFIDLKRGTGTREFQITKEDF
ncbi:hypothetical protein [Lactococcus ileimucosae]|uniref:hypothetical protein n=1 Tax=Lactococcus ileimucosae TaxID=2941329 RepID=UPI002044BE46|nr:hypothetical protein [Lactococcus ileimucosae]